MFCRIDKSKYVQGPRNPIIAFWNYICAKICPIAARRHNVRTELYLDVSWPTRVGIYTVQNIYYDFLLNMDKSVGNFDSKKI